MFSRCDASKADQHAAAAAHLVAAPRAAKLPVMAFINNAGGSLTSALMLTMLAWGVRWLRAELNRKRREEESGKQASRRTVGRFFGRLSPVALRMLVSTVLVSTVPLDWIV